MLASDKSVGPNISYRNWHILEHIYNISPRRVLCIIASLFIEGLCGWPINSRKFCFAISIKISLSKAQVRKTKIMFFIFSSCLMSWMQ